MVMGTDQIIDILLAVVIFSAIIGTIAVEIATGSNLTGASLVLYGLVPLFIVIVFVRGIVKKGKGR